MVVHLLFFLQRFSHIILLCLYVTIFTNILYVHIINTYIFIENVIFKTFKVFTLGEEMFAVSLFSGWAKYYFLH